MRLCVFPFNRLRIYPEMRIQQQLSFVFRWLLGSPFIAEVVFHTMKLGQSENISFLIVVLTCHQESDVGAFFNLCP